MHLLCSWGPTIPPNTANSAHVAQAAKQGEAEDAKAAASAAERRASAAEAAQQAAEASKLQSEAARFDAESAADAARLQLKVTLRIRIRLCTDTSIADFRSTAGAGGFQTAVGCGPLRRRVGCRSRSHPEGM